MKIPDIKVSSIVVFAGGFQSLANIAFLSVAAKNYSASDYSLIPLYFTLQGLLMVFSYQGMDSMINRAMLNNHISFYRIALKHSFRFSSMVAGALLVGFIIYNATLGLSKEYIFLGLLIIFQLPISALEKVECGLLGLNRFKELISYKSISSIISIAPLIGSLFDLKVIWLIGLIIIARLIIVALSLFSLSKIISSVEGNESYKLAFYRGEAKKITWLSAFATLLNYVWPLILYRMDPISLSVYFNGNKIPEKIKDYSKLFVSVPSQHWLKKGKEHFSTKIKEKGIYIFGVSFIFSLTLAGLSPFYIPLIFGEDYSNSILVSQIILLGVPARVLGAILQSREIFHEDDTSFFRRSNYIVAFVNLVLAIPMIYYYEEIGLALHNLAISYFGYFVSLLRFRYIERGKQTIY